MKKLEFNRIQESWYIRLLAAIYLAWLAWKVTGKERK